MVETRITNSAREPERHVSYHREGHRLSSVLRVAISLAGASWFKNSLGYSNGSAAVVDVLDPDDARAARFGEREARLEWRSAVKNSVAHRIQDNEALKSGAAQ